MTDKEQIAKWLKNKLAELCNEIQCEVPSLPKVVIEGKILAFKEMLSYMNSLQEEPVSEDLEEEIRKYLLARKGYPHIMDETEKEIVKIVRHFANWQKQQMMKNAKSGTVQENYQIILDDGAYIDLDPSMSLKPSFAVKAGERVRMIIIKQEEGYDG